MLNKETVVISVKLFVITAVAALCLAVVNRVTTPIIAENTAKAETLAQREVLPEATEFKKTEFSAKDTPNAEKNNVHIDSVSIGFDGTNTVGYVINATSGAGYGGDIRVMVGINQDLKVTRVKILESSETAGLGAKASEPEFSEQYIGKSGTLGVTRASAQNENEISAISGATVTSRAVTSCVNAALEQASAKMADGGADTAKAVNEKLAETKKATDIQIHGGGGAN